MPRSFSDHEKTSIRASLIQSAEREFGTVGLKRASVELLAKSVGISKGAFYAFFPSKEALYLAVLAAQIPGVQVRVLSHLEDRDSAPADVIERFLCALFDEYETNLVLRRLVTHPDELTSVRRAAGPDDKALKIDMGLTPLRQFFQSVDGLRVDPDEAVNVVVLATHAVINRIALESASGSDSQNTLALVLANGLFE